MNKNKAMWDYLMQYPELYAYMKFNTIDDVPGESSFSSMQSSTWEKKFVRGHGIKRYDFTVIQIKQHDTGTSDNNEVQMFDVEKFMKWIEEQNRIRNLPDFGNSEVISIENLQNMPNLAAVSEDGTAGKYMFQCRVRYYE